MLRGSTAVVDQRLMAVGLVVRRGEGHISNLEQRGGAEELHVGRIEVDGMDNEVLFHNQAGKPLALAFDGCRQSAGTGADNNNV